LTTIFGQPFPPCSGDRLPSNENSDSKFGDPGLGMLDDSDNIEVSRFDEHRSEITSVIGALEFKHHNQKEPGQKSRLLCNQRRF
jgi:hypothetical protein